MRAALRLLGQVLLWLGVALLVLVGGVLGGAYLYLHQSVAAVAAKSPSVKITAKQLRAPLAHEPAIALVIGSDYRANEPKGTPSRSDTLILIRADPGSQTISLLSLPRDLQAEIRCPAVGATPAKPPFVSKINAAYAYCGERGSLATVEGLTGLPINYLISVNFRGFVDVVDSLGGVYLDIDRRYLNTQGGPTGYATINLEPGYQLLSGRAALDFVRFRHTDSDIYRNARQQLFLRALKDRIEQEVSPTNAIFTLPKIVNAITHSVQVAQGGGGSLSAQTILSYALFADSLPSGHLSQVRIAGLQGYYNLTTSEQNLQTAVDAFLHPDVAAPEKATAAALGITPRTRTLEPRQTSIVVLNGNGAPGAAGLASSLLARRGYPVKRPPSTLVANAPNGFGYVRSRIYYDERAGGAKAAAARVANLFGSADAAPMPQMIRPYANGAMLVAIVGQTFRGALTSTPIDQTPRHAPPNVTSSSGGALDLLRQQQHAVAFPLMVPTVIESSSWVDLEQPVRVYQITGTNKALRLVYRFGGANKYWGIEETDWQGAPALGDRSLARWIRGRAYTLYFNGPHLHMAVIRSGKASYWVVNSLLDELSNETMLAIAEGLRPVDRL